MAQLIIASLKITTKHIQVLLRAELNTRFANFELWRYLVPFVVL